MFWGMFAFYVSVGLGSYNLFLVQVRKAQETKKAKVSGASNAAGSSGAKVAEGDRNQDPKV